MLSSRPGLCKQLHSILGLGHAFSRSFQQCPQRSRPHRLCTRHLAAKAGRSKSVAAQPEEDDETALPPKSIVHLDKKDFTIEQLSNKVGKEDLVLQPAYQRGLVWDKKMACRLVVTALEARVLPAVFLEEAEDGTYSVMDGKQRLVSLIAFYTGKANVGGLQWDEAPTTLHVKDDTTCDPWWHGKTFAGLPKARQRQFENYSVMCIIVKSDTDRDVVFSIYQDINTGSKGHTAQQSRKAVFHGPYVELLDQLAHNEHFLKIQGRTQPDSKEESDRELALRFFAMYRNADRFKTPMLQFLNREIKDHQKDDETELQPLRNMFKESVATVWQIWGPDACRDITATSKNALKLNESLWDATMVAVAKELEQKGRKRELTDNADTIKAMYRELLLDGNFREAKLSKSKSTVKCRIEMMTEMLRKAAPKSWRDPRRDFSRNIKQQLWDDAVAAGGAAGVMCSICGQVIHTDVDHIKAHSKGGSTTPDNAQLAHRSCNRSKGSRETRPL